jgi:hypothetical protein
MHALMVVEALVHADVRICLIITSSSRLHIEASPKNKNIPDKLPNSILSAVFGRAFHACSPAYALIPVKNVVPMIRHWVHAERSTCMHREANSKSRHHLIP